MFKNDWLIVVYSSEEKSNILFQPFWQIFEIQKYFNIPVYTCTLDIIFMTRHLQDVKCHVIFVGNVRKFEN